MVFSFITAACSAPSACPAATRGGRGGEFEGDVFWGLGPGHCLLSHSGQICKNSGDHEEGRVGRSGAGAVGLLGSD